MTEQEFEALEKTHAVVASCWNSATGSIVTVLGNEHGTPVAIRYLSTETADDFHYERINAPLTIS
ncbi:hypothetical protein [Vibrio agarivorans]|uniref:Uncharacterized protein n=1 Tax=Vibrio agarivorans TaxID=153622 RepID=A0ABT7Y741_9VIBR|nr:hypothetical protein [Vibrio agarivorans]MDN2483849.1 hypothetical protein [Vibrio agarivorans]